MRAVLVGFGVSISVVYPLDLFAWVVYARREVAVGLTYRESTSSVYPCRALNFPIMLGGMYAYDGVSYAMDNVGAAVYGDLVERVRSITECDIFDSCGGLTVGRYPIYNHVIIVIRVMRMEYVYEDFRYDRTS